MEEKRRPEIAAIVVGAGSGTRAASREDGLPKQYRPINGTPLLSRTISALADCNDIDWILPVIARDHQDLYRELQPGLELADGKLLDPVIGGADRQASVLAGREALEEKGPDLVLIHDGARPFVSKGLIGRICEGLLESEGVLPALVLADSIKFSTDGKVMEKSLDRSQLFGAQTPQGFDFEKILAAHRLAAKQLSVRQTAKKQPVRFSDDGALAQWAGIGVRLARGDEENFKVTFNSDFARAEAMLNAGAYQNQAEMETRVGSGMDIHRFEPGSRLRLGGIDIPHDCSLKGHSDADAALHVLTDALLGALAEGDIGMHFPPSDEKWKGEPSETFLSFACRRVQKRGGRIVHLDLTIVCEQPKISPHGQEMRQNIARICSIDGGRVSIKATTSENMGFIGRGEGLLAMASATIEVPRGDD